jgi:hypothetical protein
MTDPCSNDHNLRYHEQGAGLRSEVERRGSPTKASKAGRDIKPKETLFYVISPIPIQNHVFARCICMCRIVYCAWFALSATDIVISFRFDFIFRCAALHPRDPVNTADLRLFSGSRGVYRTVFSI